MHVITDERCLNYSQEFHPERPQRVADTLGLLREQTELKITWDKPAKVTDALITRAHESSRGWSPNPRGLLTAIRPIIRILTPHAVPLVAPCARWNSLRPANQLFPAPPARPSRHP